MTTETPWTPGPWILKVHHRHGHDRMVPVWYIAAENNVGIAVQPSYSNPEHEDANSRLIAAAPELYEALTLLLADVQDYPAWQRPCHAVDAAKAALAKARGEQP